jgi:hypothetical protein
LDESKYALRIAKVTGSISNRIVSFAISKANTKHDSGFFIALGQALAAKKRPPEIDYTRIGAVPRFLVEHWCGKAGHYGMWIKTLSKANVGRWSKDGEFIWNQEPNFFFIPPLCFFAHKALADFLELVLEETQDVESFSPTNVRKWVSRLKLKTARFPKIKEVRRVEDGIYFVT